MFTGDDAEYVARVASEASGYCDRQPLGPGCDPRDIAVNWCQLTLAPWPGAAPRLVGGVIWYPSDQPEQTQAYMCAHEVGHDLLEYDGWRLSRAEIERAASRIGCALLLPRRPYRRDLQRVGWDLALLEATWPLASAWIHARRIAEVTVDGAVASRWSPSGCVDRVVTDDVVIPSSATALERALARAAMAGERVEAGARLRAWPTPSGAIVLCGVDDLHFRLARTTPAPEMIVHHRR